MVTRIVVCPKAGTTDALGETRKRQISDFLKMEVIDVQTSHVYTLDIELSSDEVLSITTNLLVDPITQLVTTYNDRVFDWMVEVGYKPGVTDNIGRTARIAVQDLLGRKLRENELVFTSTQYMITGVLSREDIQKISRELLANELIETVTVLSSEEVKTNGVRIALPAFKSNSSTHVKEYDLNVSDEELLTISRRGVLALDLHEMRAIKDYFNNPSVIASRARMGLPQNPTDVELEMLAQTWSEHCKHKIFNAKVLYKDEESGETRLINSLFKTYIRGTTEKVRDNVDWLVSVFEDNAGVVAFSDKWNVVAKVETHNSPSALEPYGGAITGIVGVNRDPLGTGKGAKLMFNIFTYCFGSPFYSGKVPPRMLHPRRIREGVHKGVIDGGNQSGIPLVMGREIFDPRYGEKGGKPLVYCGTIGVMPRLIVGESSEKKQVFPGDFIVMVGGRIGKDGIHGATFSSEELHKDSPVQAVQIGDPITQKKMSDFLLEARDSGLYDAITDNGAGGLSSSIGEMATLCGGCEIWLEKAPLKYAGLDPWEILLSEAQERMTLAVPPSTIQSFLDLAERRDVDTTIIGKFTDTGQFHAKFGEKTVAFVDMKFLHDGVPQKLLKATWKRKSHEYSEATEPENYDTALKEMLARLNVCSIESKLRQYDHEVKGVSVIKPLVGKELDCPSDATVSILDHNSREGLIISAGICPHYSDIDTYCMAQSAVDEAVRRIIATGGRLPNRESLLSILDNFCWSDPEPSETNPEAEHKMAQLVRACKGLHDYAVYMGIPLISGKDSMKNDSVIQGVRISIPQTLMITGVAKIVDVKKAVTMDVKQRGDLVYIVGSTSNELGGSEFYRYLGEKKGGTPPVSNNVPSMNLEQAKPLYDSLARAIDIGLVNSAHTLSIGGLGVGLSLIAFGGMFGLEIHLNKVPTETGLANHEILFSESNGRFLVTVAKEKREAFETQMEGIQYAKLGEVLEEQRLRILGKNDNVIVDSDLRELKETWKAPLRGI